MEKRNKEGRIISAKKIVLTLDNVDKTFMNVDDLMSIKLNDNKQKYM